MYNTPSFNTFMAKQIANLQAKGKIRTSETYRVALTRFLDFNEGREIAFSEITPGLIEDFEEYLLARNNCRNTSSFYLRIIRAVYNRGVENGYADHLNPFLHVYTGVDRTRKRAVSLSVIKRLKRMDLRDKPKLEKARDLFLFSFYTRGMSFIDMAYLRRTDLRGKELCYTRHKTGQTICIHWEPDMQEIVDRYPSYPGGFLLLILVRDGSDLRLQYKNSLLLTNRCLAELSRRLGLQTPLTTYVARHSWASIAYSHNVPLSLISEGMGHESEKTTRIYLASISNTYVDRANRRIMNLL